MKRKDLLILTLLLIALNTPLAALEDPVKSADNPRILTSLNQDWKFYLGDTEGEPWSPSFDDSDWETVHVPHSLKLTSIALDDCLDDWTQATFHRDFGWYRKRIQLKGQPGNKVFIEFEGAHQVTDLWVNGEHVGQHAIGGYTPFHFDISSLMNYGEDNLICLKVDNRKREDVPPDPGPFDYIKFSGLYRDVRLVETQPVHITFNWESIHSGIRITTPSVDPLNLNATICVETAVKNESLDPMVCELVTRVIDAEGMVVLKMTQEATIIPGVEFLFSQSSGIEEDLQLWSCDDPYLYRVNSEVLVQGKAVDGLETRMGIRKIELNKHDGFLLNGKAMTMIGVNRHQQYPYVGDAVPNSLHYKDVLQIKELGFNTLRTAHYPQDNALLDACDELGILVYEEPPSWISVGNEAWFAHFEEAARRMVRNHRNHPSVVVWGAGINHRGYVPNAHYIIKQEDPTRYTASNNSEWSGLQASGPCDIFSNMDYKGIPDWTQNEYLLAMEGGGGPEVASKYKSDPLRIGMISWTAHAYYTFARNEPGKTDRTRGGMMDIFRIPKPGAKGIEWYKSEASKAPVVYFTDEWKPGVLDLTVYSNCEKVRLLLNDEEIALQKADSDSRYSGIKSPPFTFRIKQYEPGTLEAQGIIDGKVYSTFSARTPEAAYTIELHADLEGRELSADGSDIVMVHAHILDEYGTIVRDGLHQVEFSVEGPAAIVGLDSDIGSNPVNSRRGIASLLVRAGTQAGDITIKARTKGLKSSSLQLTSVPYSPDLVVTKPYHDPEKIRVDLGGEGHIVQFDWLDWTGNGKGLPEKEFVELGGFIASMKNNSTEGVIQCFGEINIYGQNGFAIGDGVYVEGGEVEISLDGLDKGHYLIRTWHFAPQANYNDHDPAFDKWNEELRLADIPFAKQLLLSVEDGSNSGEGTEARVEVGTGSSLIQSNPGIGDLEFYSDGNKAVKIRIKASGEESGIWLNCLEISRLPE